MKISGKIVDAETGRPIQGVSVMLILKSGNVTGIGVSTNSNGVFSLDHPDVKFPNTLTMTHVSYEPSVMDITTDGDYGTIELEKKVTELDPVIVTGSKKNNGWLWLLAAGVALKATAKKKAVGKIDQGTVIAVGTGAALLLGLDTIKKIFEGIGFWDSKDDKAVEAEIENPNSPFSPNFYKAAPAGSLLMTQAAAISLGNQLLAAFGPFDDDEAYAIGLMKSFKTQSQVSIFADFWQREVGGEMWRKYGGGDLLAWLRGGAWPNDRLDTEELNTIIEYVKKLPKYKV